MGRWVVGAVGGWLVGGRCVGVWLGWCVVGGLLVCLFVLWCSSSPWWTLPYQGWTLRYPKAGRGGPSQDQKTDPTLTGARGIHRIGDFGLKCDMIYAPFPCPCRPRGWQLLIRGLVKHKPALRPPCPVIRCVLLMYFIIVEVHVQSVNVHRLCIKIAPWQTSPPLAKAKVRRCPLGPLWGLWHG